jgi:hypothetical protein
MLHYPGRQVNAENGVSMRSAQGGKSETSGVRTSFVLPLYSLRTSLYLHGTPLILPLHFHYTPFVLPCTSMVLPLYFLCTSIILPSYFLVPPWYSPYTSFKGSTMEVQGEYEGSIMGVHGSTKGVHGSTRRVRGEYNGSTGK